MRHTLPFNRLPCRTFRFAAAGDRELPATTALQLVANIASLIHAMAPLEEFALAQARGDTAEIVAAAAAAAAEQAAQRSRSPSPGRRSRSRSRSPGKSGLGGDVDQLPEEETRGRQQAAAGAEGQAAAAAAADGEGGSARPKRGGSQDSRVSSHASAPSPPRSPSPAPAGAQAASSSQQTAQPPAAPAVSQLSALSGHTVHSFTASAVHSGSAAAAVAGAGGSAVAFEALLESAEALAVQASGRSPLCLARFSALPVLCNRVASALQGGLVYGMELQRQGANLRSLACPHASSGHRRQGGTPAGGQYAAGLGA